MAVIEVPERVGDEFGIVDRGGVGDLKILKAIDVTSELPALTPGTKCLLLYARSSQGRIVKIEGGPGRHLFVEELHTNCGAMVTALNSLSRQFGLSPQKVAELIVTHAPA